MSVSPRPPAWIFARPDPGEVGRLRAELGVGRVLAEVLAGRGLGDPAEARCFLFAGLEESPDPAAMAGMDAAVERILRALGSREPVVVYGDYDADGVSGLVLLVDCLRRLGGDVRHYVPDRQEEGYGLNDAALRELAARGGRLVITVDCGISALAEAELAADLGLDLIITDHHTPGPRIPRATAVLDPRRDDCPYPCKHLAGVGVAFKLAQALIAAAGGGPRPEDYLDLVALGTVADVVPLTGENRLLVRAGLAALAATRRPGLRRLLETCRLAGREITAGHVAFVLGPRINAAGRVGKADAGVELLLTEDPDRARWLAEKLERDNRERQAIEARVLGEAEELVAGAKEDARCLVLARSGWHPGVLGIAAAKLVERYHRPVVLLALEEPLARGSARSIKSFDIFAALTTCAGLLERYGGHPAAAGLTLAAGRVGELADRLEELARARLGPADLVPTLTVDAEVGTDEVNLALAEELGLLGPCGYGNPAPVLGLRSARLLGCRAVGADGEHLKLTIATEAGAALTALAFRMGGRLARVGQAPGLDLAFTLHRESWNGQQSVTLHARDVVLPGGDWVELARSAGPGRAVLVLGPDGDWAEAAAAGLGQPGPLVLHARTRAARRCATYAALEAEDAPAVVTTFYHGAYLLRRFPRLAGRLGLVVICDPRPAPLDAGSRDLARLARERLAGALEGREEVRLAVAAVPGLEEVWGDAVTALRPGPARPPAPGPSRESLGRAYRALRDNFPRGTVLELGPGKPATAALAALVGPGLVDAALGVLEELGLIELWAGEGAVRLMLNPAPATRLDLNESPSFLEGCPGREGKQ